MARLKWAAAKDKSELDKFYPTLEKIKARFTTRKPQVTRTQRDNNT